MPAPSLRALHDNPRVKDRRPVGAEEHRIDIDLAYARVIDDELRQPDEAIGELLPVDRRTAPR